MTPTAEELSYLHADPLLWEQELYVCPDVAQAIERATGQRAGRLYWRSGHDHLYALKLADLGRGYPSMATVYGHWERYEPRPPEHELDADLLDFSLWVADVAISLDPSDIARVAQHARIPTTWPEGTVLRTPDACFHEIPDFPYAPQYVMVEGLRMAYVEHGTGDPIFMLHGEPTWGYLYRHMMPPLADIGRLIVPDLIGFGRSDKPMAEHTYSVKAHVRWLRRFIESLDLRRITLVGQDWGGVLGLRVVAQMPERFSHLVAMNTDLPDGRDPGEAFRRWRRFAQRQRALDVPAMMRRAVRHRTLTEAKAAAYGAPFPSPAYQTAALVFPRLLPTRPDHPGAYDNRCAIATLRTLNLPVLLPWADSDAITGAWEEHVHSIFQRVVPPPTIAHAGHFLQEDAGDEIAGHIRAWLLQTTP